MNVEIWPSPSKFEFDKRLIVLSEMTLVGLGRLKGSSHIEVWGGAMGWLIVK
jgi:hypothetical protein